MTEVINRPENEVKTFLYEFPSCTTEELTFKLEVPVDIPLPGSTRELVQRVITMFHIPVFLEDGKYFIFSYATKVANGRIIPYRHTLNQ